MALSNDLAQAGHAPRQLDVTATCTFEKGTGGWAITTMQLDLTADVPGMDNAAFQVAANGAKSGCPVSKALAGNVAINLNARLKTS
jgi:osmotically inducible protein OsmC